MEEDFDPSSEKTQTALKLLDLAFHNNTGDQEALNAIRAYRRVSKGMLPSILYEEYFGDGSDVIREDEWQDLFAKQEIELSGLRAEVRRLNKSIDESKRRQRRASEQPAVQKDDTPLPELTISDAEWQAILHLVPVKHRNEKGRDRIAAMIVILRTGCGWRVLGTPDKPQGWTTLYNQYNTKWRHEPWWIEMMETLER